MQAKLTAGKERRSAPAPRELGEREKEDLVEQIEEFEGPDRREKRGSDPEPPKEPGVARS